MSTIEHKRDYWRTRIAQRVRASNYRGAEAVGTVLDVRGGVWGYGGDAVALVLDVQDDWGMDYWPASLCELAAE